MKIRKEQKKMKDFKWLLIISVVFICFNSCTDNTSETNDKLFLSTGYYENGNIKFINLKNSDSLISGKSYLFYKDGKKLAEANLKNGIKSGETITYNDGKIVSLENYENDKLNGQVKYYIDGLLEEEGEYNNGLKTGFWNLYEDNKLIQSELFKNDSLKELIYKDKEYFKKAEKFMLESPKNDSN